MNFRRLQWWPNEIWNAKVSQKPLFPVGVQKKLRGVPHQHIYPLEIARHSVPQGSMAEINYHTRLLPVIILDVTMKTQTLKLLCCIILFTLVCVHFPSSLHSSTPTVPLRIPTPHSSFPIEYPSFIKFSC